MDATIITTVLIPTATAVGGWIAGKFTRKKEAINAMQKSIDELITKNTEYIATIKKLNERVLELENTNAKLVVGQKELREQLEALTVENTTLVKQVEELKKTKQKTKAKDETK